tara:strand:- start:6326 stop:9082 length:2757 start_codon:yes stop_codon:yes gene_type:complete
VGKMETKKFLERVLGDGYYSVLGLGDKKVQSFHATIDDVIDKANQLDAEGINAYFGLATFETSNDRKVTNVKSLSSFYLDLDCGVGKEYTNQNEAFHDLKRFTKETGLPRPMLINSGYGIHVYWVLRESVSYAEWLPVAQALKDMCIRHNLSADNGVTADAARVLRVPGTHNHKRGTQKPVMFFGTGEFRDVEFDEFSRLIGAEGVNVPTKVDNEESAFKKAMIENSENSFRVILNKTIKGEGCEQLKNIMENQQDISEPLWRAGLSIAKFCNDADKAVHKMSERHPEYSENLTEEKVGPIKAPYYCTTFEAENPEPCLACSHRGKINSPIVLGMGIKKAPVSKDIPLYPEPYFRGANGGVYIRFKDKDGNIEDKVIYQNDLYVIKRIMDVEVGEAIVMRLHLPQDGIREFTVPLTSVTSKEELRKQLSMHGIAVLRMDDIMAYTTTWVTQLQAKSVAEEARRQFGWTDDECGGFVLGGEEITLDETKFNPPSTPTAGLFPSFEPKGTLEDWKDTVNFYNRDSFELHQFVLGTSFGSPLMKFSPINCAALHIYSKESGVGKTTAMIAGASVWGSPEDLIMHERDTYNTKMNRGEIYHNLPMYMDELTNTSGKELSNLAYQLTGGRQRGRMSASSNVERHRGEAWKLLAVTTGNTSMVERISIIKAMPKAEAQRILECRVSRMQFDTKEETDVFSACLQNNYGHAGKVYIKHVMENLEEVQKLIRQVQEKVDARAGLTAENRYWSVLVACTLTGIMLAKRCGLVKYDVKKLFNWAVERLKENKRQVEDMSISVEETLNDYIHEHWSNVLWIKSTEDLRKQEGDVANLVIPEALPRGKLVARYETDLKRAFLVPKPLKAWCGEHQINYNSFLQDLTTKLGATKTKMRLSRGTHMNLPPTWVIQVDCAIDDEITTGNTEVG